MAPNDELTKVNPFTKPQPKLWAKGVEKRIKFALKTLAESNKGPDAERSGLRHRHTTRYNGKVFGS